MEKTEKKGIFPRIYNWFVSLTVKGLLGAILVVFILILIISSISYLPSLIGRASSSLSAALYSIFVPAERATLTVDKKIINSGEDFAINFNNGDTTNGIYTISYACTSGLELLSVENSGLKKINCENQYYLLENPNSITIRTLTQDNVVRLVIEGSFENNDTQKIEKVGVARVTIKNDSVGTVVIPPNTENPTVINNNPPTTTYVPPTVIQPIYYGKPDLAIRMLQTGTLDSRTNIITNKNIFTDQEMVGIKFEVRNDGDANTGVWNFTATLPSLSTPVFNSNPQISLRPGESIIFTLGFSNLTNQYTSQININVDPQNIVKESAEYNNKVLSTIINANYNNNNNYNTNNNYNNGCYINGVFTYNCNYNYDWDYKYNNDLRVNCYAKPNNPETGDRVRWYADVTGGDEDDYDYDWTGTNSLDSSVKNPSKTYTSRGWKYATVTIESAGDEATASCSVYVD
jgi:hypothetical protein